MKLIGWQYLVKSGRRWRSAGLAGRLAIMGLVLASGLQVAAQEPEAADQTNDLAAAEVLARISEMVQAAESGEFDDMAAPEDLTATNGLSQATGSTQSHDRSEKVSSPGSSNHSPSPSRSQNEDRRSRGRRPSKPRPDPGSGSRSTSDYGQGADRTPASAPAGTNGSLAKLDYSSFKVIVERNIFDPNRYPHRGEARVRPAPKTVDSLTLVGTMSYEKGWFAFFDGSSSEYKKALKLTDTIAGYKVTDIAPSNVKLAAGTNRLELKVGMQMRREEDGPWLLAGQSGSYPTALTSTSTNPVAAAATAGSDATAGGAESDIIKRLMQKRQQE